MLKSLPSRYLTSVSLFDGLRGALRNDWSQSCRLPFVPACRVLGLHDITTQPSPATNQSAQLPDRAFYGRAIAIDVESTLRGLSNEECATRDTAEAHWFARLWEATGTASWKMARYINSEAAANDVLILFN